MLSKSSAAGTVQRIRIRPGTSLYALYLKHGFKAAVHFFFFDNLPAPGCR